MDQTEEKEIEIRHTFDYSNSVPEEENILYLAQLCESFYNKMLQLFDAEEEKNKKLNSEYAYYEFKKSYTVGFSVEIREKNIISTLSCKSYYALMDAVKQGHLKNVEKLVITLDLSYRRGKDLKLANHENLFKIVFEPYNITFIRHSNYDDVNMDQVENTINEVLKKFKIQNTIFCSK